MMPSAAFDHCSKFLMPLNESFRMKLGICKLWSTFRSERGAVVLLMYDIHTAKITSTNSALPNKQNVLERLKCVELGKLTWKPVEKLSIMWYNKVFVASFRDGFWCVMRKGITWCEALRIYDSSSWQRKRSMCNWEEKTLKGWKQLEVSVFGWRWSCLTMALQLTLKEMERQMEGYWERLALFVAKIWIVTTFHKQRYSSSRTIVVHIIVVRT